MDQSYEKTARLTELKEQLAELYRMREDFELHSHYWPKTISVEDDVMVREMEASVQTHPNRKAKENTARALQHIRKVTESTDITLAKLIKETNDDPTLKLLRQAIEDKETHVIPSEYRRWEKELSSELGLVFKEGKVVIPTILRELMLHIAHADHEGTKKMEHYLDNVYWPDKSGDIKKKVKECLSCFKAGKNVKAILPKTEVNRLPTSREIRRERSN